MSSSKKDAKKPAIVPETSSSKSQSQAHPVKGNHVSTSSATPSTDITTNKASARIPPHRKVIQEAASMQYDPHLPATFDALALASTSNTSTASTSAGGNIEDYEQGKAASTSSKSSAASKKSKCSESDVDKQAVRDLDAWFEKQQR